jgi:hypothetical protein
MGKCGWAARRPEGRAGTVPKRPECRHCPDILGECQGDLLIKPLVGRIVTHVVDDFGMDG